MPDATISVFGKMVKKGPTDFAIIKEYLCAVSIRDGRLYLCRLNRSGKMRMSESGPEWESVRSPVGQDFLDLVNKALGTSFTENDFKRDKLALR